MVLIRRYPNGAEIHGPPYTQAEEDDFYRRVGGGPVAILRGPKASYPEPTTIAPEPVVTPTLLRALRRAALVERRRSRSPRPPPPVKGPA